MLRQRARLFSVLLQCSEVMLLIGSLFIASWIHSWILGEPLMATEEVRHQYLIFLLFTAPTYLLIARSQGLMQSFRFQTIWSESRSIGRTVLLAALMTTSVVFILHGTTVSRMVILSWFGLFAILAGAERALLRVIMRQLRVRGHNYRNVIFVGAGLHALTLAESIEAHPILGLRILGFIDDHRSIARVPPKSIVGPIERFVSILNASVVDGVVFTVDPDYSDEVRKAFEYCQTTGVTVYYSPSFMNLHPAPMTERLGNIETFMFPANGSDSGALAKRSLDLILAFIFLAGAAPLMLLIALAIKWTSAGPVIFKQARVGLNGRIFVLYKFRTMVFDAERLRKSLETLNEMDGPVFKINDDPRVTRLGRWLRRSSCDELPQLFNVLRGEMSIVGPRPPLPSEVSLYEHWHRRRLSVRPGLTCLWQVSGRNDIDFQTWMKLDMQYIDNPSIWVDLKIIAKTVPAMLRGR